MAKPKPTYCKNCGEGVYCKTFEKTNKACRKGKAVGKAVSETTKKKNAEYEERLSKYYEQYFLYCDIFNVTSDEISFYKWLKARDSKTASKYYRVKQKRKQWSPKFTEEELKEIKAIDESVSAEELKYWIRETQKKEKVRTWLQK